MNSAMGMISLPLHACFKVNSFCTDDAPLFALCKQMLVLYQTNCLQKSLLFWFSFKDLHLELNTKDIHPVQKHK